MTNFSKYDFIYSETEIKNFFQKISKPWNNIDKNERCFLTLAARPKYITEEQKKKINLNKTMMLERKVITYESKKFLEFLKESTEIQTNNSKKEYLNQKLKDELLKRLIHSIKIWERIGKLYQAPSREIVNELVSIPENSFVIYFYVNPIDLHKFYNIFTCTTIQDLHTNLLDMVSKVDKQIHEEHILDIYQRLAKLDRFAKINYSQSIKASYWKDIDIDLTDPEKKKIINPGLVIDLLKIELENIMKSMNTVPHDTSFIQTFLNESLYLIDSQSGFHLGFQSKILSYIKAGPEKIIRLIKDIFYQVGYCECIKEIIENKNLQVPLPGTFQRQHKVKLLF